MGVAQPSSDEHFVGLLVEQRTFINVEALAADYVVSTGASSVARGRPIGEVYGVRLPPRVDLTCATPSTCSTNLTAVIRIERSPTSVTRCTYAPVGGPGSLSFVACDDSLGSVANPRRMTALSFELVASRPATQDVHATARLVYASQLRLACSGVLISPNAVITAAHCVTSRDSADDDTSFAVLDPAAVTVLVTRDMFATPFVGTRHQAAEIHPLPSLRYPVRLNKHNDVALLRLRTPIDHVAPVALAPPTLPPVAAGDVLRVTAFGAEDDEPGPPRSGKRLTGEVRVTSNSAGIIEIEPFSYGVAWISGDSGGGLVYERRENGPPTRCPGVPALEAIVQGHNSSQGIINFERAVELAPHRAFIGATIADWSTHYL